MKRLIWTALILLSPVFCASAVACTCAPEYKMTPEQVKAKRLKSFNDADAVFTGKAVREKDGKVTFKVYRIWKGDPVDEIVMTNYLSEELDDGSVVVYMNTTCEYQFSVGDRFLIYAHAGNRTRTASICGRTTNFRHSELYEQETEALNEITQPKVRNKEPK